MDCKAFYEALFAPLRAKLGPPDQHALGAIVGFDAGGPLAFRTFGSDASKAVITYVSCELAVRADQKPGALGRYELLASSSDRDWVRTILSDIGRMTLDVAFGDGHTMDIGGWVNDGGLEPPLQGVLFVEECRTLIEGNAYGVLRVIGITRPEMEFARANGSARLLACLEEAGVYPDTATNRRSVL
jgi:hypothetical protein